MKRLASAVIMIAVLLPSIAASQCYKERTGRHKINYDGIDDIFYEKHVPAGDR